MERAPLGLKTNLLANPLDLGGKRGERFLRLDRGPEGAGTALLELADAADAGREILGADAVQLVRQIIGELLRRKTLLFNGYGESVAHLYQGLEHERLYA